MRQWPMQIPPIVEGFVHKLNVTVNQHSQLLYGGIEVLSTDTRWQHRQITRSLVSRLDERSIGVLFELSSDGVGVVGDTNGDARGVLLLHKYDALVHLEQATSCSFNERMKRDRMCMRGKPSMIWVSIEAFSAFPTSTSESQGLWGSDTCSRVCEPVSQMYMSVMYICLMLESMSLTASQSSRMTSKVVRGLRMI